MKRALIVAGAIVLVLVVALGAVVAATFRGRKPISDGLDIRSAHIVADGTTSMAIVAIGGGQVALVDAGEDPAGRALLAAMAAKHLARTSVTAILLTHGHADHIGAVKLFPRAQVMALDAAVPVVEGRARTHGPVTWFIPARSTGITVTRRLHDGETFMLGDKMVRVFAMPGHTAGSAAYLFDDLLFIGDSADVKADGTLVGAPWVFTDSQSQNRASLRRLARTLGQEDVPVRAIVPAHSGVADGLLPLLAFAD
ncbi:MAG TPA: MBL fold metallo-hydrolase [Vicinamibacterales bacterium]|nr:MBL fold metallo-hydrolase [Vicinamibacterales bacterium]